MDRHRRCRYRWQRRKRSRALGSLEREYLTCGKVGSTRGGRSEEESNHPRQGCFRLLRLCGSNRCSGNLVGTLITGRRPHFFPRAITGSSKTRRHFSFGSEAYFSFSAMVRYRSRLGSVFAAHFLNSGSSPPWRSFSSPRRPGRRTQRIKARLLFIAQRTVEFRERGLHGLHRAKRGVEPLLHRLDPTRGGQRLVG
jgi:hypothetical protein